MSYVLHTGDCLDVLPTLAEGSVDVVVTSPPYNLVQSRYVAIAYARLEEAMAATPPVL